MIIIEHGLLHELLLIFFSASIFSAICLYLRQAVIVAYILAGLALGPVGLAIVTDASWIEDIGSVGIVYLLFLMGLNLKPQKAISLFGEALSVTLGSVVLFVSFVSSLVYFFDFNLVDSMIVGVATSFSSTIVGLKLLPTTTLHHKRRGELIIAVLLLQDFLAIGFLLVFSSITDGSHLLSKVSMTVVILPVAIFFVFLSEKYIIDALIKKFDEVHEFLFLLAIAWCSVCALIFESINLSYEVGGFVAGVALASSPASEFFAEKLKPVRDFFLVLFFFALGAGLSRADFESTFLEALLLAFLLVLIKPLVFSWLFSKQGESRRQAKEVGIRLGQAGEFGILLGLTALDSDIISTEANSLIQLTIVLSIILSSLFISRNFPTPGSARTKLRKD